MTTINNIMALADEYAGRSQLTEQGETLSREALRTALTEALARPIQTLGCTSNCENCTYAHGSPAHAGYCYMFYDEPQGVCGQWKDANHSVSINDMVAQTVREPLTPEHIERIYQRYGGYMINCTRAIERAHGIGGEK